jgi:hypothetical protein
MQNVEIRIATIVDGGICVAASDGQKVYQELYKVVSAKNRAILSFDSVTRMTTAFLNAAVGQLYGEFSEEYIKAHLGPPIDFEQWHLKRLKLVVDRAKEYFSDPKRHAAIYRDHLGDDEE